MLCSSFYWLTSYLFLQFERFSGPPKAAKKPVTEPPPRREVLKPRERRQSERDREERVKTQQQKEPKDKERDRDRTARREREKPAEREWDRGKETSPTRERRRRERERERRERDEKGRVSGGGVLVYHNSQVHVLYLITKYVYGPIKRMHLSSPTCSLFGEVGITQRMLECHFNVTLFNRYSVPVY